MSTFDLFTTTNFHGLICRHLVTIADKAKRGDLLHADIKCFADQIENAVYSLVLNRGEAARFLGVCVRTLDRWCLERGLPRHYRRINPGKRPAPMFFLDDLLEWQHRQLADSPTTRHEQGDRQ